MAEPLTIALVESKQAEVQLAARRLAEAVRESTEVTARFALECALKDAKEGTPASGQAGEGGESKPIGTGSTRS
jgi:hypothetical protein